MKHVTPKQFNDLLSKTFGGDKPQLPLDRLTLPSPPRLLAVQPNRCVIPLQNYQAEDRDPNMSLRLAPEAFKNGMAVPPPIPACNK